MRYKNRIFLFLIFFLFIISCDNNNTTPQKIILDGVSINLNGRTECVKKITIYTNSNFSVPTITIKEDEVKEDTTLLFDKPIDKMRMVFICTNSSENEQYYAITCKFLYHGKEVKKKRLNGNLKAETQKQIYAEFK